MYNNIKTNANNKTIKITKKALATLEWAVRAGGIAAKLT
jgi:hypothetical protein